MTITDHHCSPNLKKDDLQFKTMDEQLSTPGDKADLSPKHPVTETSPPKKIYNHDSNTESIEKTGSNRFKILSDSRAISLCSLADKIGTAYKDRLIPIWHNENFNSKSFTDPIPGKHVCRPASEDFARQSKKGKCSIVIL